MLFVWERSIKAVVKVVWSKQLWGRHVACSWFVCDCSRKLLRYGYCIVSERRSCSNLQSLFCLYMSLLAFIAVSSLTLVPAPAPQARAHNNPHHIHTEFSLSLPSIGNQISKTNHKSRVIRLIPDLLDFKIQENTLGRLVGLWRRTVMDQFHPNVARKCTNFYLLNAEISLRQLLTVV